MARGLLALCLLAGMTACHNAVTNNVATLNDTTLVLHCLFDTAVGAKKLADIDALYYTRQFGDTLLIENTPLLQYLDSGFNYPLKPVTRSQICALATNQKPFNHFLVITQFINKDAVYTATMEHYGVNYMLDSAAHALNDVVTGKPYAGNDSCVYSGMCTGSVTVRLKVVNGKALMQRP